MGLASPTIRPRVTFNSGLASTGLILKTRPRGYRLNEYILEYIITTANVGLIDRYIR